MSALRVLDPMVKRELSARVELLSGRREATRGALGRIARALGIVDRKAG